MSDKELTKRPAGRPKGSVSYANRSPMLIDYLRLRRPLIDRAIAELEAPSGDLKFAADVAKFCGNHAYGQPTARTESKQSITQNKKSMSVRLDANPKKLLEDPDKRRELASGLNMLMNAEPMKTVADVRAPAEPAQRDQQPSGTKPPVDLEKAAQQALKPLDAEPEPLDFGDGVHARRTDEGEWTLYQRKADRDLVVHVFDCLEDDDAEENIGRYVDSARDEGLL